MLDSDLLFKRYDIELLKGLNQFYFFHSELLEPIVLYIKSMELLSRVQKGDDFITFENAEKYFEVSHSQISQNSAKFINVFRTCHFPFSPISVMMSLIPL